MTTSNSPNELSKLSYVYLIIYWILGILIYIIILYSWLKKRQHFGII